MTGQDYWRSSMCPETAVRDPDAEIGPVHMRVPPGAEGVAFGVSLGQPG